MSYLIEILPDSAEIFRKLRNSILVIGKLVRNIEDFKTITSSFLMSFQFYFDAHFIGALEQGANKKEITELLLFPCS